MPWMADVPKPTHRLHLKFCLKLLWNVHVHMCCLILIKVKRLVKIFGIIIVTSIHCTLSHDSILAYNVVLSLVPNSSKDYRIMVQIMVSDSAGTQPEWKNLFIINK